MQRSLSMSASPTSPVYPVKVRKVEPKDLSPRTTQLLERSPFVHDVREYFSRNPVPTFYADSGSPLGLYFKKLVGGEIKAKYEPRVAFPDSSDLPIASAMNLRPLDSGKKRFYTCVHQRTVPEEDSVKVNGSFARMYIPKCEGYGNKANMIVDLFDRTAYSNMGANAFDFPVVFMEDGVWVEKKFEVKCVEEGFQLLKCFYCGNPEAVLEHIYKNSETVQDTKKLSKVTTDFQHEAWNAVSYNMMFWVVLRACVGEDSYLFKLLCNIVRGSLDCAIHFGNCNVGSADVYICETPAFYDDTWALGVPLDVCQIQMEKLIEKGLLGEFEEMMRDPLQPMGPKKNYFDAKAKNQLGRILTIIARLMKGWCLDFEGDDSSMDIFLLEKMKAFVKEVCPPMIFISPSDDNNMEGVVQWPDINESSLSSDALSPRPGAWTPVPFGVQQGMFPICDGAPLSPTDYAFKTPEPLMPVPKMLVQQEVHPGSPKMGFDSPTGAYAHLRLDTSFGGGAAAFTRPSRVRSESRRQLSYGEGPGEDGRP